MTGNKPMRVAPEFSKMVKNIQNTVNQTSAEITRDIANLMRKKR